MVVFLIGIFLCLALVLATRVGLLIWKIRRKRASFSWPRSIGTLGDDDAKRSNFPTKTARRTLIVLGSGGHTSEMIQLICNVPPAEFHPLIFVKAATDKTSVGRVQAANLLPPDSAVYEIPRAREVGQSYISSVYSTLYAFSYAAQLVASLRPDVLLCNGPGTCLPLCVAAFGWRIVGWTTNIRIIFVESFCRVETMSLTGRLLYPWVDLCVVHWPNLQTNYPLTQCISTMIQHDEKDQ